MRTTTRWQANAAGTVVGKLWQTGTLLVSACLLMQAAYGQEKPVQTPKRAPASHATAQPQTGEEQRVQEKEIVAVLLKEGVLRNTENYSIRITNEALFVNGAAQPTALHERILKTYVKRPHERLSYTYTVSTSVK